MDKLTDKHKKRDTKNNNTKELMDSLAATIQEKI